MRKVFVFGSNRRGVHGAGAALHARKFHGALWGVGEGPMPEHTSPSCYAIPTKDERILTLPLDVIRSHVETFLTFARVRTDLHFSVTRIGCGLAGYHDKEIGPLFHGAPENCELPPGWGSAPTQHQEEHTE